MIRKLLAFLDDTFASLAAFGQTHQFKATVTEAMRGGQHMIKKKVADGVSLFSCCSQHRAALANLTSKDVP